MSFVRLSIAIGFIFLTFSKISGQGIPSITATIVESWVTDDLPSSDYNLNSAYVYLINGNVLGELFKGKGLNRLEKRKLSIKKGDYPQYMYLAVSIKDPLKKGQDMTIPLMIHDVRDPRNMSKVTEYGGRFLTNVPDEILKEGDIVAKVKFEAIKGNETPEFWRKTAKISIDLGKTASMLVSAPLSFLNMTNQVIPQVSEGLKTLDNVDKNGKMTSEFYIKLLDKEMSALFQEKVVSASLYNIHWDAAPSRKTRYFGNLSNAQSVNDLKNKVTTGLQCFILVVQTKSEYNTDHSELAYNQQYIRRKSKDFRNIRNLQKKEVEKEFLEVLKLSLELKKQIEIFENSLSAKYRDWQSFSKMIDLYYDIQAQRNEQIAKLSQFPPIIKDKYNRLYANVGTDIDLWFTNELLTKARDIASYLYKYRGFEDYNTLNQRTLYEHIELLSFYRDRVQQTEIQGRIPKEIESLETYLITKKQLKTIEETLFGKAFRIPAGLSPERQKELLINLASNEYPLCEYCSQKVQERIAAIDKATYTENVNRFLRISADYYNNLTCYDKIYQKLTVFVKTNTDSLTVSPFLFQGMQKDKEEFIALFDTYGKIASRDYTSFKQRELADLLGEYDITRNKLSLLLNRLEGVIYRREELPCFFNKP